MFFHDDKHCFLKDSSDCMEVKMWWTDIEKSPLPIWFRAYFSFNNLYLKRDNFYQVLAQFYFVTCWNLRFYCYYIKKNEILIYEGEVNFFIFKVSIINRHIKPFINVLQELSKSGSLLRILHRLSLLIPTKIQCTIVITIL